MPIQLNIKKGDSDYSRNNDQIAYITDIHIDHKIATTSKQTDVYKIRTYINNLVSNFAIDMDDNFSYKLLVGGDTSFDYSITELFYKELRKNLGDKHIFSVLGNHELWDVNKWNKCNKTKNQISCYLEY